MQPSLTEQLAKWLIEQRTMGIPDNILDRAHYYTLDWLGSALAGSNTEPGKMLLAYAQQQSSTDMGNPCQIIGTDIYRSAETAALVNGGLSHIVEMDDLDRGSVLHPATVVIPAALALKDRLGLSGREFLSAVVVGYEIAIRIGEAVGKGHYYYFHNTATCGIFGAAAAAGWLLGLNTEQLVWALGNAGTQAAGLWQFNNEGDMSKHLHAGIAASHGLRAADLAAHNFTGARHILEGERGFLAAMAPDAEPSKIVAMLGQSPYKIHGVSIKPHSSCRHTHPAVDAALTIRARLNERFNDWAVQSCQVDTYQAALDLCDNPDPQTPYAAKFSLYYCVASALVNGQVGLVNFTPTAIQKPSMRQQLSGITVRCDSEFEERYPREWPARVTVTLTDGTQICEQVDHPKGDPENALTLDELTVKFRDLAAFGGHDQNVDRWLQLVVGS